MLRHFTASFNSILLLLASMLAPSSQAQATVTGATYYVNSLSYSSCGTGIVACRAEFTQMPNKYILFSNVSCIITTTKALKYIVFGVQTSLNAGENLRSTYIPFVNAAVSTNTYTYTVNQEVLILFGPNRYPVVSVGLTSAGNADLECTIAGETVAGP